MQELYIPREALNQIAEHSISCYPDEGCGILVGTGNTATKFYPMTNAEPSPVSYLMDPAEQFRLMKSLRAEGSRMVAIFHSHPQSPAYPSTKDVSLAFYDDLFYVIAGMVDGAVSDIRAFRIIDGEINEAKITVTG